MMHLHSTEQYPLPSVSGLYPMIILIWVHLTEECYTKVGNQQKQNFNS